MKLKFFSVLLLTTCLFQTLLFSADSEESKRSLEETREWLKQTKNIRPFTRMKSGSPIVSKKKKRRSSSSENSVLLVSTLFFAINPPFAQDTLKGNRKERRAHLQKTLSETSF